MEHFCNSDHNIVVWDLVLTTYITDKLHKNMFYQANYFEMRDCLSKINWDEVLPNKDVEICELLYGGTKQCNRHICTTN